jgi:hypothetical protein
MNVTNETRAEPDDFPMHEGVGCAVSGYPGER